MSRLLPTNLMTGLSTACRCISREGFRFTVASIQVSMLLGSGLSSGRSRGRQQSSRCPGRRFPQA